MAGSAPPYWRMLVMGDSSAWGMSASRPDYAWASVAARQIRDFGSPNLELVNSGIPASVVSPRNPSYTVSAKPSLIERCGPDCAQLDPDLVVIAEAVNDVRAGMSIAHHAADLEAVVADVKQASRALVMLVGFITRCMGAVRMTRASTLIGVAGSPEI